MPLDPGPGGWTLVGFLVAVIGGFLSGTVVTKGQYDAVVSLWRERWQAERERSQRLETVLERSVGTTRSAIDVTGKALEH